MHPIEIADSVLRAAIEVPSGQDDLAVPRSAPASELEATRRCVSNSSFILPRLSSAIPNITVFGGTGFIGRHLVPLLLRDGAKVRVAARNPDRLHVAAGLEVVRADVLEDNAVARAIAGAEVVFNLVGILTEMKQQTYRALHVEGAQRVARAAKRQNVARLIHISALGASPASPAESDRTKADGELAVRAAFPEATIVRPSLVYGEDDHFFNSFAAMTRRTPAVPLIGGGETKFQPVSVADMTAGLALFPKRPDTAGKTYEFGGLEVYSFRELLELLLATLERRRFLLPIPFTIAEINATLLELLPSPPLTRDQVRLLKTDKVVSGKEPTLCDLGIQPRPLREFLALLREKQRHSAIHSTGSRGP